MIVTEPTRPAPQAQTDAPSGTLPREEIPFWRSGVVVALIVLLLVAYRLNPPLSLLPHAGVVMTLPGEVGKFIGLDSPISKAELTLLPKDTEFVRKDYQDFTGNEVLCSIVLSGAEQRSIHRPEVCLVAQGWTIIGQENVPIHLASGHDLVVRKLSIQHDVVDAMNQRHTIRAFYMYWFVGEGITTPSHFTRVFVSSWDRIVHGRAHRWAYVIAMSAIGDSIRPGGANAEQTQAVMTNFIRAVVPSFQKTEMTTATGT